MIWFALSNSTINLLKVYQTNFNSFNDENPGNCWQAVIASLLELPLEQVPHFAAEKYMHKVEREFLLSHGYRYERTLRNPYCLGYKGDDLFWTLKKLKGIKGYFSAMVYSPKYFHRDMLFGVDTIPAHAVIVDQELNFVHDPNPAYADLKEYPLAVQVGYRGIIAIDIISKI